jgi:hypothetical protein
MLFFYLSENAGLHIKQGAFDGSRIEANRARQRSPFTISAEGGRNLTPIDSRSYHARRVKQAV